MTTDEMNALRKLAERATPGPWENDAPGRVGKSYPGWGKGTVCIASDYSGRSREDAAFIAAASPTQVIVLLDRIAALEDKVDELSARGVHTCHANCQRTACVLRRERDAWKAKAQELGERSRK